MSRSAKNKKQSKGKTQSLTQSYSENAAKILRSSSQTVRPQYIILNGCVVSAKDLKLYGD